MKLTVVRSKIFLHFIFISLEWSVPNPCRKYPCQEHHVCLLSSIDPVGRTCKCPDNLSEMAVRYGDTSICHNVTQPCPLKCNQGICKLVNGQPKCKCTIDFDGEFCEHYRCSGFCKNRGVCYIDASKVKMYNENLRPPLKCACPPAWTGDHCETPIANCTTPCYNGVCSGKFGDCVCEAGFTGSECRDCADLHCENGGICRKDQLGISQCECTKDFKGIRCEYSPCEGFCNGHGACTLHNDSPNCECNSGYWGKQCQSDECTDYCQNGGTCTITPDNEKICECMTNYSGIRCEIYRITGHTLTDCNNLRCENGGTCHVIRNEAYCNCTAQFLGLNCQVNL